MEEDDLLGGEQDLRRHLQRGPRIVGEGAKGRRMDGLSYRGATQGAQDQFYPDKGAVGKHPEAACG